MLRLWMGLNGREGYQERFERVVKNKDIYMSG
jgi:hypothetical protein